MSGNPTNQELTEEVGSGSLVINRFANTGRLSTEVRSVRFEKTLGKFGKELLPNIAVVQDFDCGDFLVQNINYQHSFVRASGIHR